MNSYQEVCAAQDMDTFCFVELSDSKLGTIYTNLPGPFLVCSIQNIQYIFVYYCYQSNAILDRLMKTKSDAYMGEAYQDIY